MSAKRAILGFRRNVDGPAAVEFAACTPVFIAMVFGFIQFGLTQHEFSSVRYAMQSAARALVIDPTLSQGAIQTLVDERLAGITSAQVTVDLDKAMTANGVIATLSATYVARFGVPTVATFNIPYTVTIEKALRPTP